jgi:hypothetical protein
MRPKRRTVCVRPEDNSKRRLEINFIGLLPFNGLRMNSAKRRIRMLGLANTYGGNSRLPAQLCLPARLCPA